MWNCPQTLLGTWNARLSASREKSKTMLNFNIAHCKTKTALNLKDQLTGNSEAVVRGCESGNTALVAGAGSAAKLATTGWLLCSSLAVTMATGVTVLLFVGVPRPPLGWLPLKYNSSSGCLCIFQHSTLTHMHNINGFGCLNCPMPQLRVCLSYQCTLQDRQNLWTEEKTE